MAGARWSSEREGAQRAWPPRARLRPYARASIVGSSTMFGADDDALYVFEREPRDLRAPPTRRRGEEAAQSLKILKRRLGITDVSLTADLEKLLLRYCSDTILNILWYDRARRREQR